MTSHLVLSLDFELHWGIRDHTAVAAVEDHLRATRAAIPRILDLFSEFGVHATWATVGFLMAADRDELHDSLPRLRPPYTDRALDPYRALDTLGHDENEDPLHYAASLVTAVANAPGQEVGTHTLSHYYAMEDGPDLHHFAADLAAAKAVHTRLGLPFDSLVFPRNQFTEAHVQVAAGVGIIAVRGNATGSMNRAATTRGEGPLRRGSRLADAYLPLTGSNVRQSTRCPGSRAVDVPSSRFLRPYSARLSSLEPLRQRRITRSMTAAAERGGDFHLWWHPHNFGRHTEANFAVLRHVLEHHRTLRDRLGMGTATMAERARAHLAHAA